MATLLAERKDGPLLRSGESDEKRGEALFVAGFVRPPSLVVETHEDDRVVLKPLALVATLSPRRLQRLLEDCVSVKVKRLFFYFADRHAHAWLKALDRNTIDLGSGNRVLAKGGRLDPTYKITVPRSLDAGQ